MCTNRKRAHTKPIVNLNPGALDDIGNDRRNCSRDSSWWMVHFQSLSLYTMFLTLCQQTINTLRGPALPIHRLGNLLFIASFIQSLAWTHWNFLGYAKNLVYSTVRKFRTWTLETRRILMLLFSVTPDSDILQNSWAEVDYRLDV